MINSIIVHHLIIPTTVNGGGALRRIVSLKLKQKFWPSNAPYVCLDVVKFSLDKGDLTGYYIHNGKSVRLQTLFSNSLNYDLCDYVIDYDSFNQSIFISNPLLTSSLVIVHHSTFQSQLRLFSGMRGFWFQHLHHLIGKPLS